MERQRKMGQKIQPMSPAKSVAPRVAVPPSVEKKSSDVNVRLADLVFELRSDATEDKDLDEVRAKVKEILLEKKREELSLIGILGKCMIPGCDVHTLTLSGDIIEHIPTDGEINSVFSRAREILRNADTATVGILVYESKLEILCLDGTTKLA